MKKCCKCKEEKTLDQFSLRSNKKYYLSQCKACCAKRSNKWYLENKERSLTSRKKYYADHKDETLAKCKIHYEKNREKILKRHSDFCKTPEQREKSRIRNNEWRKNNPEKIKSRCLQWKKSNPLKAKAHQYVLWALRLDVLKKPTTCEACGKIIKLEGHHKDYAKPLEVIWLCKLCHESEHHKDEYERSSTIGLDIHLHRKEGEEINVFS